MQLQKLYKRTTLKQIQEWEINIKDNSFWTEEGIMGGIITKSKPTICEGKNQGKINATSNDEQAIKEAQAKWDKKCEKGYTTNVDDIDTSKKFFEPMLAKKYLDYKDDIKFPVLVSTKIDGARMVAQKSGLWTRNGKEYKSCPHISDILKPLFDKHPNFIIDGEIYAPNLNFESVMSLVKKTKPEPEDIIESEKTAQYWVFDGIVDDTSLGFKDRFKIIQDEIKSIVGKNKSIVFVKTEEVNSHEEIETKHNEFVSQGFEGLMIRIPDSIYQNKRSKYLLKYKKFLDSEFIVVDILEGKGQRNGLAGNVLLKTKDGKEFGAGIRGDENYYKEILKNKKKYIGGKATIRYQEETNFGVPRFPVVIELNRFDIN
jgi:DNA ligase-1